MLYTNILVLQPRQVRFHAHSVAARSNRHRHCRRTIFIYTYICDVYRIGAWDWIDPLHRPADSIVNVEFLLYVPETWTHLFYVIFQKI
jgi:hypothetical protein